MRHVTSCKPRRLTPAKCVRLMVVVRTSHEKTAHPGRNSHFGKEDLRAHRTCVTSSSASPTLTFSRIGPSSRCADACSLTQSRHRDTHRRFSREKGQRIVCQHGTTTTTQCIGRHLTASPKSIKSRLKAPIGACYHWAWSPHHRLHSVEDVFRAGKDSLLFQVCTFGCFTSEQTLKARKDKVVHVSRDDHFRRTEAPRQLDVL